MDDMGIMKGDIMMLLHRMHSSCPTCERWRRRLSGRGKKAEQQLIRDTSTEVQTATKRRGSGKHALATSGGGGGGIQAHVDGRSRR